ncbi:histone-lysine N-methyltransferase ATXR2-like [Syzygium oleosum]|uniref:histone-lysine N-methyltransferase ATXR2-like n=1 Tax=Syzygium oleosum TaxID=219896 RepID=UPI0024BA6F7F|nr:histone-lysine N-methyltransferase ATXR2-like [Syzygium oleosum]
MAHVMDNFHMPLLLEAWKPISFGHKRRWWECIALPEDVDPSKEAVFRMEIKELAFECSLVMLDHYFVGCIPLFSSSLPFHAKFANSFCYSASDLVVASSVEDYFLFINDLSSPEKEEAKKVSQPYLDALGDEYADRDGQATIVALKPISKGEEEEAKKVSQPYLDALGDEYAVCCEGMRNFNS